MATRTITGTIYHAGGNYAWNGAIVRFRMLNPFATANITYPGDEIAATTNVNGQLSVTLTVPDTGSTYYGITFPDGSGIVIALEAGPPITLETLINEAHSIGVAQNTLQVAIDAHAGVIASETILGHVKVDGSTVFADSNGVLSSSGGAPTNAPFITQVPVSQLTGEQALSSLASGYLKNTTTTGILSSQAPPLPVADLPLLAASGTGHAAGIVPDPGASAGITKFLREDAVWAIPSGSGGSSSIGLIKTTADNTGVSDATAQLRSDLTAAIAAGHGRLYLPAGTYKISLTTGNLFDTGQNGVEIFGDGIGITVIKYTNITLTGFASAVRYTGKNQILRDLSIVCVGMSGSFDFSGVNIDYGCFYPTIRRIECVGMYGSGTAGGVGIGLAQGRNTIEFTTTLSIAVTSTGSQIATPVSMSGIYPGRRVLVGSEEVIVTTVTETTFTAIFTATHIISSSITIYSDGRQYALIEDCVVRDSFKACAYGDASSVNVYRRCIAIRGGATSTQHAFYSQGGYNVLDSCYVEGWSGFHFHCYKHTPNLDAAGTKIINCVSINPGTAHLILDTDQGDGSWPSIGTAYTNRYASVIGNTFRNTNQHTSDGLTIKIPTMISGNIFEDIWGINGLGWIDDFNQIPGSVIAGNYFTSTNPPPNNVGVNCSLIRSNGGEINGNRVDVAAALGFKVFTLSGNNICVGNRIKTSGAVNQTGIVYQGSSITAANNTIDMGTGSANDFSVFPISDITIRGNRMSGNYISFDVDLSVITRFRFEDNELLNNAPLFYNNLPPLAVFHGNSGKISKGNLTAMTLESSSRLLQITTNGSALTAQRLVGISGGPLTTSDTIFLGIATSSTPASAVSTLLIARSGDIGTIDTDSAWTSSHYGIPSTTTAAKIHDSGTSAPASGSYVFFLDSGGAAGSARVMIVKTI
jgi:hypothetical protein